MSDSDDTEQLLRKAKAYVQKQKRRKKSREERKSRRDEPVDDDDDNDNNNNDSDDNDRRHKKKKSRKDESAKRRSSSSRREDESKRSKEKKSRSHSKSSSSSRKKTKDDDDDAGIDEHEIKDNMKKDHDKSERQRRKDKRKRKDDRRKRSEDSDDDDDDDHERHSRRDRKKHKSSRKDRKDKESKEKRDKGKKDKKKSKEKSTSGSASATKTEKLPKRKKVDKSKLHSMGNIRGKPPTKALDPEDDYFEYHQHLFVFLYREEGLAFGDLTSEQAREAFARFCDKYNKGELEDEYYRWNKKLPPEVVEESKTTRHKWNFQTSATELKSLELVGQGVRKQTEYDRDVPGSGVARAPSGPVGPSRQPDRTQEKESGNGRRFKTPEERLEERRTNRRLKEHVRTVTEELTGGRKTGRERQIELKKEKAAALHGAARDREEARAGGVELDDSTLYGEDGKNSFNAAVARERQRKAARQDKKNARVAELQAKEHERQEAMLKALGLTGIKPGQKIKIAPRES